MNIQSLSVVVPNDRCINNCAFCVSKMNCNTYINQMDDNLPFFDLYMEDYLKRLEFARHNGCNTVMLTGNSEPQQNRKFLTYFGMFMKMMKDPFQWIEMQTTGVLIDQNYLRFLRNHVGVNLISLSISAPDETINDEFIGVQSSVRDRSMPLMDLCHEIKRYDFSLRLSLNMTDAFLKYIDDPEHPEKIFNWANSLGADQITFRILYDGGGSSSQEKWIREHGLSENDMIFLLTHIRHNGKRIGVLPYGATKYSIHGMSVVIDDDCMSKRITSDDVSDIYKYLILQPNCKLYSQWDDSASLVF